MRFKDGHFLHDFFVILCDCRDLFRQIFLLFLHGLNLLINSAAQIKELLNVLCCLRKDLNGDIFWHAFLDIVAELLYITSVMKETKKEVEDAAPKPELIDELASFDVDSLIPKMDSNPDIIQEERECIVGDAELLGLYDEIKANARADRAQADEILMNFIDMVMNDGDSSSASKEAVVNLMKIKADINDKLSKVADLETRIKLKERDTFPRYLAQQQNNKVVIEGGKRDFLKMIAKAKDKKKQDDK